MLTRKETIIRDFHSCPLTKQVFCHPVLASDGYHYELIALLQQPLISPFTLELITHIQYDLKLKNMVDNQVNDNQYPFYEKQEPLNNLIKALETRENPWKQSAYEISKVGFSVLNALILLDVALVYLLPPKFMVLIAILAAFVDLVFRSASHHRYGLFAGSAMILKKLSTCLDILNPDELRFG